MTTLCVPGFRWSSPWTISPVSPTPTIVLSEATTMSEPKGATGIEPATRMTYGSFAAAYFASPAWSGTVTTSPPAPPVVPPAREAKPCGRSAWRGDAVCPAGPAWASPTVPRVRAATRPSTAANALPGPGKRLLRRCVIAALPTGVRMRCGYRGPIRNRVNVAVPACPSPAGASANSPSRAPTQRQGVAANSRPVGRKPSPRS